MFIELTEFLRCPQDHPEVHCVLATGAMNGRDVVRGIVGCSACQREYHIERSIIRFGAPPPPAAEPESMPDAPTVQALLGIEPPGGHIILVGSAARLAPGLGNLLPGIQIVGVNAPSQRDEITALSLLESESAIPLRTAMARGVVLGGEYVNPLWSAEAVRVLLPGLRLVALAPTVEVTGVRRLVAERGMWVGQKER